MERSEIRVEKYVQAKERITAIRKFYVGLVRLAIFTILLFILDDRALQIFIDKGLDDEDILYWVNWSLWSIPITIAFIMLLKGIWLFGFKNNSIKKWEERRIKKMMEEDDSFE